MISAPSSAALPDFFKNVPRETIEQLETYAALLMRWQAKINLVSASTLPNIWERHFADSAQLFPLLKDKNGVLLDFGSGAGFPGMVLATLGCTNVHLVESDRKKCIFLREVARSLGVAVEIHNERIENLQIPTVSTITSRGCASLNKLLAFSESFFQENTQCLFPKGENYTKELEEAKNFWDAEFTLHPSSTNALVNIIEVQRLTRKTS